MMDEVTLYPTLPRTKFLLRILAFLALLIWNIIAPGSTVLWFALAMIGIGIIMYLIPLLPGCCRLRLGKDGFEVTYLYLTRQYAWGEVSGIDVRLIKVTKFVVFETSAGDALSKANRQNYGGDKVLMSDYGMSAEDLAALMRQYQSAAMGR